MVRAVVVVNVVYLSVLGVVVEGFVTSARSLVSVFGSSTSGRDNELGTEDGLEGVSIFTAVSFSL